MARPLITPRPIRPPAALPGAKNMTTTPSVYQPTFPSLDLSLDEKIARSIGVLRMWQPKARQLAPKSGYWGAFSGGKDSTVIKELARLAGVQVTWHYNVTTIDPPELVRFIREQHPDVVFERPERPFFRAMIDEGYPTRILRWCCAKFKEGNGSGSVLITGVRWAESPRRRRTWKQFQRWDQTKNHHRSEAGVSWMCNPIIDWANEDVWRFIRREQLPYCSLYDEGFKRLGCIGCPMSGAKGVQRDFARWPGYERAWRRAFHRLWDRRHGEKMTRGKRKGKLWPGLPGIENADQLFEWWQSGLAAPMEDDGCQLGLW